MQSIRVPDLSMTGLHEQYRNVVHYAGQNQCTAHIKSSNPDSPFQGMGFPVGRRKRHDAGDIKRAGTHKSQRLRLAHDPCHGLTKYGIVGRNGKGGAKSRIQNSSVSDEYRIQHTQDRLFGERRAQEAHKGSPAKPEYPLLC